MTLYLELILPCPHRLVLLKSRKKLPLDLARLSHARRCRGARRAKTAAIQISAIRTRCARGRIPTTGRVRAIPEAYRPGQHRRTTFIMITFASLSSRLCETRRRVHALRRRRADKKQTTQAGPDIYKGRDRASICHLDSRKRKSLVRHQPRDFVLAILTLS